LVKIVKIMAEYLYTDNHPNESPDCNFADFEIAIRGDHAPYAVTCSYAGRDAEGEFRDSIDDQYWRQLLAHLGGADHLPGEQMIAEAGSELFNELIRGDIRDLWMRARSDMERGAIRGLRLRLAITPPAVSALPWESLYDPDRKLPLAADARTPLVRAERLYRHVGPSRPLETALPVRLLLAVPDDPSDAIDADAEILGLQKALTSIGPDLLEITILRGRFGVIELREALEGAQADILHIITHGQSDGLLFWQNNEPRLVQPNALRMTLQRAPSIKLVLLNACLAGQQANDESPFSTVGPQLLQAGIPAVIAMQFEITDEDAINLARHLYEELLYPPCAGAIDVALTNARSTLYALNPDSFAFGTPVLWLNADQGIVFRLPASAMQTIRPPAPFAPPLADEPTPDPELSLDVTAMEKWLSAIGAEITEFSATADTPEWRGEYRNWQRHVDELEGALGQLRHMQEDAEAVSQDALAKKRDQIEQSRATIARLTDKLREMAANPTAAPPPAG